MQRECRRVIAGTTLLSCLFAPQSAQAMDVAVAKNDQDPCEEAVVEGYEPNTFGYTKQSDDVAFVDFTISIKAQLFRDLLCQRLRGKSRLYLTFTGRFGFYVRTRNSGPDIAKNYNPKLLWRVIPDPAATTPSTAYDVTGRGEVGFYVFGVPLTVWAQDGYMNSLARYYKKTKSGGIELRFAQF
jgi:hypothetical protein